jgi:hypothetical protein
VSASNAIWPCQQPAVWPAPPDEMTYSALSGIEACPRRWALHSAKYPELWDGHGYPPRVAIKALLGTIVHEVTEFVSKEFVRAGCMTIKDAKAIEVMRGLGGYSKLIGRGIEIVIKRAEQNPRARKVLQELGTVLRGKMPEIRSQVQGLLANVSLSVKAAVGHSAQARSRGQPLPYGLYAELTLRAKDIGWKGKPDLLGIDNRGCEIVEFKTGERKDEHAFQLRVYGALWSKDGEANPGGHFPSKLTVAYPDGSVEIPFLSADKLSGFVAELRNRSTSAASEVLKSPPLARPSVENCSFCGVKQLCAEYWSPDIQPRVQPDSALGRYGDLQVLITGRHGPTSWDAVTESAGTVPPGSSALIRCSSTDLQFQVGQRLRLISVWFGGNTEGSNTKVVTAGLNTEAYLID